MLISSSESARLYTRISSIIHTRGAVLVPKAHRLNVFTDPLFDKFARAQLPTRVPLIYSLFVDVVAS